MPDKQMTELSSSGALGDADLLLTRQDGATEDKKITASQIRTYIETAFNIDNLSNGTTNTFLKIGAGTNSLLSHDATGAYLEGDIAIGYSASAGIDGGTATDHKNTALGYNAHASGRYSTAIGQEASATGLNSIALGDTALSSGYKSIAIGNDTSATAERTVAIKGGATADGAVGIKGTASAENAIAIGATASHAESIVIGTGNYSTDENQFVISGKILKLDGIGAATRAALEIAHDPADNKRSVQFVYNTRGASGSPGLAISDDNTWHYLPAQSAWLGGDEFFGEITFTGTDHAGIILNNLTSTQRGALTAAAGMIIYNETTGQIEGYQDGSWVGLGSGSGGGGDVSSVNGQTGSVSLDADDIDDTSTTNKFATSAQLTKLDGIEAGATANTGALADLNTVDTAQIADDAINAAKLDTTNSPSDNQILSYDSASGGFTWVNDQTGAGGSGVDSVNGETGAVTLDADDIDDSSTTHKFATATQLSKLDGIATGATANSSDTTLLSRANHTGTQSMSTISDAGNLATLDTVDTAQIDDDAVTAAKLADTYVETNPSGVTGADAITNIMSLTTAEYSAIGSPNSSTLYIITDAS